MRRKDIDKEFGRLKSWQIEEVKKGLAEAERGEFASDEDVKTMFEKFAR